MRVATVGAGAIARACAALAARGGHAAALWSTRGGGARDLRAIPKADDAWHGARSAELAYDGIVEGVCNVALLPQPQALSAADLVVVAVPAPAYASVLPAIAPHIGSRQTVFVSGALSLAPLWLSELSASHARRPVVSASGTTIATARARPGGVTVLTVRTRLAVAALPRAAEESALAIMREVFGDRFDAAPSLLAITLGNVNPVAHAALALANFTRIERAEAWAQYHYLTPAVARVIEAMDAERRAVARGFGVPATTIEEHFQRSFNVMETDLAGIAAELHRRRGGPPGPATTDTRFVLEDVPFGLVFNEALARILAVETPVTHAAIALHGALYARDFRAENPMIDALQLATATRESLLARSGR
jgi:opine dehydrogenase